jgi:hypothetical protein
MTGWNVTGCVSGVVTKVGQSPGISVGICYWHLPPSWNSYHTQSMHIKGVWYTLYVVSGHMVVAKHGRLECDRLCKWGCDQSGTITWNSCSILWLAPPTLLKLISNPHIKGVWCTLYVNSGQLVVAKNDRLECDRLCKWGCDQSGTITWHSCSILWLAPPTFLKLISHPVHEN